MRTGDIWGKRWRYRLHCVSTRLPPANPHHHWETSSKHQASFRMPQDTLYHLYASENKHWPIRLRLHKASADASDQFGVAVQFWSEPLIVLTGVSLLMQVLTVTSSVIGSLLSCFKTRSTFSARATKTAIESIQKIICCYMIVQLVWWITININRVPNNVTFLWMWLYEQAIHLQIDLRLPHWRQTVRSCTWVLSVLAQSAAADPLVAQGMWVEGKTTWGCSRRSTPQVPRNLAAEYCEF